MDFIGLKRFLEDNSNIVEWGRVEEDLGAIFLKSSVWDTIIRVDLDKLDSITCEEILMQLMAGKNVEQMTRVTGYFSKTNYWNKGKLAELKDRYRIKGGMIE